MRPEDDDNREGAKTTKSLCALLWSSDPWLFRSSARPAGAAEKTFPAPAVGVSSAGLRQTSANYWQWRLAESPELATRVGRTEHNNRWRTGRRPHAQRARAAREEFLQQVLYVGAGNLTAGRTPERRSARVRAAHGARSRAVLRAGRARLAVGRSAQPGVRDHRPDAGANGARLREHHCASARASRSTSTSRSSLHARADRRGLRAAGSRGQPDDRSGRRRRRAPRRTSHRCWPRSRRSRARSPRPEQNRLRAEARSRTPQQFVPSWKRLETFLRDTYLKQARTQTRR